jgi:hypothetical protein
MRSCATTCLLRQNLIGVDEDDDGKESEEGEPGSARRIRRGTHSSSPIIPNPSVEFFSRIFTRLPRGAPWLADFGILKAMLTNSGKKGLEKRIVPKEIRCNPLRCHTVTSTPIFFVSGFHTPFLQ